MKVRHPHTRIHYERQTDGTVLVDDQKGGSGTFDRSGNWVSGTRRAADPMLCMYVADGYLSVSENIWSIDEDETNEEKAA